MIWLAWRRQRAVAVISAAVTGVLIALLLTVRFIAAARLERDGIAGCDVHTCDDVLMNAFQNDYRDLYFPMVMILFAVPVLLGLFAGAPLFAREVEQGTHVLALTQSVGRVRWWATKVLVAAGPLLVTALALGLASEWTTRTLRLVTGSPIRTPMFETRGLVVVAYALLAFALAATAGLVLRNTLGAFALALGLYVVLLGVTGNVLRPQYAAPERETHSTATEGYDRFEVTGDEWLMRNGYLTADGKEAELPQLCDDDCIRDNGIAWVYLDYQPADRYLRFQLTESAIIAAVALLAAFGGAPALRRLRP